MKPLSDSSTLSIYIPQDKLAFQPIERMQALAAKRDRSLNWLVVEAILQYLGEQEQLDSGSARLARTNQKANSSASKTNPRARSGSGRAVESDEQATARIRMLASKVARSIDTGDAPSFVHLTGTGKIHVVVSEVLPPEGDETGISLARWRDQFRIALTQELVELDWEIRGGNRFWRGGTDERDSNSVQQVSNRSQQRSVRNSGCLGALAVSLCALFWIVSAVSSPSTGGSLWTGLSLLGLGLLSRGNWMAR